MENSTLSINFDSKFQICLNKERATPINAFDLISSYKNWLTRIGLLTNQGITVD